MKAINKFLIALAVAVPLMSACQKEGAADADAGKTAAAVTIPPVPGVDDDAGWGTYVTAVVKSNIEGVEGAPFVYLLPSPNSPDYAGSKDRLLTQVQNDVARGVLPGNMLAFASPDSKAGAAMAADALGYAEPGSMRGVTILFIGKAEDQAAVKAAADKAGATFKFVETK